MTSAALELQYQSDFRMLQVIVVEFQLHHKTSQYNKTASGSNEGYIQTPSADLCASVNSACRQNGFFLFESCSVVLDNTCCQWSISTSSESESAASGASTDGKTATVQYKPVASLTDNNNALAHYEQSCGYNQISYALFNIHGCIGAAVISLSHTHIQFEPV